MEKYEAIVNRASQEQLDERWYSRFEAVSFEDYEKLTGRKEVREKERELFLRGENRNPTLDYPELESFDMDARESELLSLKEDVLEQEQNDVVKKIYRTKINELLATVRMLQAAKGKNDRKFSRYADFIYGKPQASESNYVFRHVQELLESSAGEDNESVQVAKERLRAVFDGLDTSNDEGVDASFLPAGQQIEGNVADVDEAVAAFEQALQELNVDDWTVVVDSEKGLSSFSVSQEHKVVRVPSDEKLQERKISRKKLQGLLAHEIGTHVARRHNGERSKLKLLGLGLDRYLPGEEGVATYNEQMVTGAKEFAGVPRYISIALAKGVDGKPRDFRETFEIMRDYHLITSSKKSEADAALTAYNDCVRIFRGSTCQTPGAVYPKDMAYMGNRRVWELVSKDSDVVQQFSIGKYDPTNGEHVALLSQLGILDDDLDKIESDS